jgi:anti-sigma factor RsiW
MSCTKYEDAIVDLARGGGTHDTDAPVLAHVGHCEACAARLARERTLSAGLHALARSTAAAGSSDALEQRLLEAFAAEHGRSAAARSGWRGWIAAAAAAAILVTGLTLAWRIEEAPVDPVPEGSMAPAADSAGFVAWPGAAVLPAFESGQLVRTELPVTVLPMLGLVPASTPANGKVVADVLVGQDGLARAVRLAR